MFGSVSLSTKTGLTKSGPHKSQPQWENVKSSVSLSSGNEGMGGLKYLWPSSFLHTTQSLISFLITWQPLTSQYLSHNCVSVSFTRLCPTVSWHFLTMSLVTSWLPGNIIGNLAPYSKRACESLPPHLKILFLSQNNLNDFCNWAYLSEFGISLWTSLITKFSAPCKSDKKTSFSTLIFLCFLNEFEY